jgi:tRNA dimethylallyltransferase
MSKKIVVFIVGPTAVGKSKVAYYLAKRINFEIISCDSMQVYREMDIGTSKPSTKLTGEIPHHLIDQIKPNEEFNVAKFKDKVLILIQKLHQKQKIPLLVGGSGLYMQVLLDGLFEEKKDKRIREKLKRQVNSEGINSLYEKLKEVDPETAGNVHPNNKRRIIRALEVYYNLGLPISIAKKRTKGIYEKYNVHLFGLMRPRQDLYKRINQRVDKMIKEGLIEEVKTVKEKYNLSKTAKEAIGYKEIIAYLEGKYSLEEAIRIIKRNTRHLAKKQLTWFRREKRIQWVHIKENQSSEQIAEDIYEKIKNQI